MDFFVILNKNKIVYRIDVHAEIQEELTSRFISYADKFLNEGLEVVPFQNNNFRPDETEVIEIKQFDLPNFLFDPLQNVEGWEILPNEEDVISKISCIFGYDADQDILIFQVIRNQQRLTRNCLNLILRNNIFTRLENSGFVLGNECHAVFKNGSLKFKSLWWLSQIIDIDEYYRPATDADVDAFCNLPTLKVEDANFLKNECGRWYRTRIAYILDSQKLINFTPEQLKEKSEYVQSVELKLVSENGEDKIFIPKDRRALRVLLKFLEEEIYLGPITGDTFETNSKRMV